MKADMLNIAALVAISLLLVHPIFEDGYLIAQDNPPHLAESYYLIEELVPNGKLFGWSNIESAGFPIFAFNYPLGYWVAALFHFGLGLNVVIAYKLLVYLSYLGPIILVYLILKNTFNKIVALVTATLLLFQFDFLSFILNGLWGQYFGLIFGLIYIYLLTKHELKLKLPHFILVGIVILLSFLSHPFTTIFLAYFTVIFLFITFIADRTKMKKLLLTLAIGWLIAAVLVPWNLFLDSRSLLQTYPSLESENLSTLTFKSMGYLFLPHLRAESIKTEIGWERGEILFGNVMGNFGSLVAFSTLNIAELIFSILVIIGLANYFRQKRKGLEMTVYLVALIFSVVIASGGLKPILENYLPLVSGLVQAPRYFIYARVVMAFFAAYGLAMLFKTALLTESHKNFLKNNLAISYLSLCLVLLLSFTQVQDLINTKTSADADGIGDVERVWSWVRENVSPDEARVFYQNTYGNSGNLDLRNSHVFTLSTQQTGVESIGTWQGGFPTISKKIYSGSGQLLESTVQEIEIQEIVEAVKTYNAAYFVTSEENLENKLESSNLFDKKANYGNFSIFSLKDYFPTWIRINGEDIKSEVLDNRTENKKFKFHVEDEKSIITIKITYHPYWMALINNEEVEISRNDFGMIELASNESGDKVLELIYRNK